MSDGPGGSGGRTQANRSQPLIPGILGGMTLEHQLYLVNKRSDYAKVIASENWPRPGAILGLALAIPVCRYRLLGFLRREVTYQGLPTSYWSWQIQRCEANQDGPPPSRSKLMTSLFARFGIREDQFIPSPAIVTTDPEALPVLAELLDAGDPRVRRLALDCLMYLNPVNKRSLVPVYARALSHQDKDVRSKAAFALLDCGRDAADAVPELIRALREEDGDDRVFIAVVLSVVAPSESRAAVPVLRGALRDRAGAYREQAAWCLARLGPAAGDAIPELACVARDLDDDVRTTAAEALVSIDPRGDVSVPILVEMLRDRTRKDRHLAAELLGRLGPHARDAVPELRTLLDDADPVVREAAVVALEQISADS